MNPPSVYPIWKPRTVRARSSAVESSSDHTLMPTVPSVTPSPSSTAASVATAELQPNAATTVSPRPTMSRPKKTIEALRVPILSNITPLAALDSVRHAPMSEMSAAAKMRSIPSETSRTLKYPIASIETLPSMTIATSMSAYRRLGSGSSRWTTARCLAGSTGLPSNGSRPISSGVLRMKRNVIEPMTSAIPASTANATESELVSMTAAMIAGIAIPATPLPTAAMPTALPTCPLYQRLMMVVVATMPPSPYPIPVKTAARQNPPRLPACENRMNPSATSRDATKAPRRVFSFW